MNRRLTIVVVLVALVMLGCLALAAALTVVALGARLPGFGSKVALIRVEGPIYDARSVIAALKRHGDNGRVKALVVRFDSPGGVVGASQELYAEIGKFRDGTYSGRPVPVVASFGNVAASGAYYAACAANRIFANPGSVTGSIGVIFESPEASDLLGKIGLRFNTITSGEFKDTGNFARPMTERERALLQSWIDDVYDQFTDAVIDSRGDAVADILAEAGATTEGAVSEEAITAHVKSLADGRVMTGKQALEAGLVDELGTLEDALMAARRLAGIPRDAAVVEIKPKPTFTDMLLSSAETVVEALGRMLRPKTYVPGQYRLNL